MSDKLSLFVHGVPSPQGSKTRMPNGAMVEAGSKTGREKLTSWRSDLREALLRAMTHRETIAGQPVAVTCIFFLPRPKSQRRAQWQRSKPDLDKLLRAVLDQLVQALVIDDDSRVAFIAGYKVYPHPKQPHTGAHIIVHPLGDEDEVDVLMPR